jgi:hypothetical protein
MANIEQKALRILPDKENLNRLAASEGEPHLVHNVSVAAPPLLAIEFPPIRNRDVSNHELGVGDSVIDLRENGIARLSNIDADGFQAEVPDRLILDGRFEDVLPTRVISRVETHGNKDLVHEFVSPEAVEKNARMHMFPDWKRGLKLRFSRGA